MRVMLRRSGGLSRWSFGMLVVPGEVIHLGQVY